MKRGTSTPAKDFLEPGEEISFFDQVDFVKSFCFLEDRLNARGGSEAAITARTRIGWIKFKECEELPYGKKSALKMKERTYQSCVRPTMLCGARRGV